jgi:uncharacterized protein (TIGR03435 family)
MGSGRPGPNAKCGHKPESAPEISGVPIFTALQQQLGLKLESGKAPVPVLVIDRVEKLTQN